MSDFDSMVDDGANQAAPAQMPQPNTPQSQPAASAPSFDSMKDDSETYGGTAQGVAAGAEGALKGLIGPLAPIAEKLAGVSYASQRGRAEAHPVAHGVSEAGGLLGGFLTGSGEAALATKAGTIAKGAIGLGKVAEEASLAAKIGSAAVQQAAEMAVLQSGDNVAKRILQDPQAATEGAMAHVGLAAGLGAAGGAFGAGVVSPLWKATIGPKVAAGLESLKSSMGGSISDAAARTSEELEQQTGVAMPKEMKAVINDVPGAKYGHSYLSQNDTSIAGRAYQKTANEYESNLAAKTIQAMGKDPLAIENLPDLDKYAAGRAQGEALASEIKNMAKPTIDGYNAFNEEAKDSLISNARKQAIADQIGQKSIEQGWHKAEDKSSHELAAKVIKGLDDQESVADLKKYITNLRNSHPFGKETYGAARDIGRILHGNLEDSVAENILRAGGSSESAVEKVSSYNKLRQDYSKLMTHIENLNEHLHVGKYDGPESFLNALKDHSTQHGERVLNQLSGKNNAAVLDLLKSTPETLNLVKQQHVDNLLNEAVQKAPPGKKVNANHLVNTLLDPKKTSPQVRDLILSQQGRSTVEGVSKVLDALKDPTHNFSNTARTAAKNSHGAISPLSFLAMMLGHGSAGLMSVLGPLGMNEARPALRLAMMRFLSSDAPVNAAGFKTLANFADSAYRSENALGKATKSLFTPGFQVFKESQMPSSKDIQRLDKLVSEHKDNPNKLMDSQTGHLGHYMPQHDMASAKATQQSLQYLQSLKPHPVKTGPLDRDIEPSPAAEARYNRALSIAQNPLVVLQHVKDGTLQTSDIQDLKAMYPAYSNVITQAVSDQMVNRKSEDGAIPYQTRIGISLLLGQPLDSSMNPNSIQSAQAVFLPKPPPQQPQGAQKPKSTNKQTIGKSNNQYKTPSQSAESDRANRD